MLDKKTSQQILDAIHQKPRTVQEIAKLLDRNWRTAERYIEQLMRENGMIAVRTFREGSRGALKIVYWNTLESGQGSAYQDRLLRQIEVGVEKTDFSPFDIYQFVPEKSRTAKFRNEEKKKEDSYSQLISRAQQQVLFFSGNLSWATDEPQIMKTILAAAKRRVSIKIITRLDITSLDHTKELLAINKQAGWDAVEIRHCKQPLRAAIIDDECARYKEVLLPIKIKELKKDVVMFYEISDPEWISWSKKVFWKFWNESVDAETRIAALSTIKQK